MGSFELLDTSDSAVRFRVTEAMSARGFLETLGCSKPTIARVLTGGQLVHTTDAAGATNAAIAVDATAAGRATNPVNATAPEKPLQGDGKSLPSLSYEDLLAKNDIVTLRFSTGRRSTGTSHVPVDIIFEDRFILAAQKPAGLLVHSDGTGSETLSARVQGHLAEHRSPATAQALQRLDVDTTGIVLFSLTEEFQPVFDRMVENGSIRKRYLAIVSGRFPKGMQTISQPIGRDRHDAQRMRVSPTGQAATTRVECIASAAGKSLLLVEILTGRRHQIRVHLAHMGYPVVGDALYGDARMTDGRAAGIGTGNGCAGGSGAGNGRTGGNVGGANLMLHAYEESFTHPLSGEKLVLRTAWPERFSRWFPQMDID